MAIKKGDPIDFSWTEKTNNKTKQHSGKWQLRVSVSHTRDNITIHPYIVISGSDFKESRKCTIVCEYQSYSIGADKTWRTGDVTYDNKLGSLEKKESSKNIRSKGTHKDIMSAKTLNTQKVTVTATINGKKSKVKITAGYDPPNPIPIHHHEDYYDNNPNGLYHKISDPWTYYVCFKFEPVWRDYAAPVDWFSVERRDDYTQSWSSVIPNSSGRQNTKHDANGFVNYFQDRVPAEYGKTYQWRVKFGNAIGESNFLYIPVNTSTNKITDDAGDVVAVGQINALKEWAYTPPNSISDVTLLKNGNVVTIGWSRPIDDVDKGTTRGYFIQYQTNGNIHDNKDWVYSKSGEKVNDKALYTMYIEDRNDLLNPRATINIHCKSSKIRFRVVPFNFDYGVVPTRSGFNKALTKYVAPGTKNVQTNLLSSASEIVYFTPAKADGVTAVRKSNGTTQVTVDYHTASNGSVNRIRIYRKYHYVTGDYSDDWSLCWIDQDTPMPEEGLDTIVTEEKEFVFTDIQLIPDTHMGKEVDGVTYRVELGAVYDTELSPKGKDRFSGPTDMVGFSSSLSKPNPPTLLFPEKDRVYPTNIDSIYLSWSHNPTDSTNQTQARLNLFVFDSGVSVPQDFLIDYMNSVPSAVKNQISIPDDSSFYEMDVQNLRVTKITGIDTDTKTVTSYVQNAALSANDNILWRVQTKGSFAEFSDFTYEYRPFVLCGVPSIDLYIPDLFGEGTIDTLPVTVFWDYRDESGTLSSLNLYLSDGNSILETYRADLSESVDSYSFTYLFDNNETYMVTAEAVSTTGLSADGSIAFTMKYEEITLRKEVVINAEFDSETGVAHVSLVERENEVDEETDDIVIDGKVVSATKSEINYYSEIKDGKLKVLAFLSTPLEGISLSAGFDNAGAIFPGNNVYPGPTFVPMTTVVTDSEKTTYVVYEGPYDYPIGSNYFRLELTAPKDRGEFEYEENGVKKRANPVKTTLYERNEGTDNIPPKLPGPFYAIVYSDFDELDQPDKPTIIDKDSNEAHLFRLYRGAKSYIGGFNVDHTDDSVISASIYDKFCPINREFKYQLIQLTSPDSSGKRRVAYSEFTYEFHSLYWYSYWGTDYEFIAKARWNPTGSASYSRPEQQLVRYSGREYPVVYDSNAMEETFSLSIELFEDGYMEEYLNDSKTALETIEDYRQLMAAGGIGFWKSFDGDVYFAKFDFSYSIDYTDRIKKYPCSLSVTRVDGTEVF